MSDLISRSALIKNFKMSGILDSEDDMWVYSYAILMIESTPTVEAIPKEKLDEIVEKLEEEKVCVYNEYLEESVDMVFLDEAIEIVKGESK